MESHRTILMVEVLFGPNLCVSIMFYPIHLQHVGVQLQAFTDVSNVCFDIVTSSRN